MNALLSVDQVAEEFGVREGSIRAWIRTGRLKPARTDARGKYFFTRGQLLQLLTGFCPVCGNVFKRIRVTKEFCSDACRKDSHRIQAETGQAPDRAPRVVDS